MTSSAADLEALKAKLADAVKNPLTYSQLVPLQASLDAADAARYHDDGSLPDNDNVTLIDECYGERGWAQDEAPRWKKASATERRRRRLRSVLKKKRCLYSVALLPSSARGIGFHRS